MVDDVPANQKVGLAMLQSLGLQVDLADNGQQALELWRQQRHDLILMDCRMPVMDGYEASRAIRASRSGEHVPIIALTAGVAKTDEERCLAAGMSDYLAKPFKKQALSEKLGQWMEHADTEAAEPAAPLANSRVSPASELDLAHLQQMRQDLGEDFPELIDSFYESAADIMQRLQQVDQQPEQIALLAHSMKSCAANVGATGLSRMSARLQHTAEAGEEYAEQIERMQAEYLIVQDQLKQI